MSDIIDYILQFLLGEQIKPEIRGQVGYTDNPEEFDKYKLIILPSGFFDNDMYGTEQSLPHLPLRIWEETPIIFGEPSIEQIGDTRIIKADLVASTYFLISRYEEMVRPKVRDTHGRFLGKESLPYRAGFIDRPLVEEYGKLLRSQLREVCCEVPEPPAKIQKIYLTHDVDQLAHYRNIRGMVGGVLRGLKWPKEGNRALKSYFMGLKYDPWYTFPWLFMQDNALKKVLGEERSETIVFFRTGGGRKKEDKPISNLILPDFQTLLKYCRKKNVTIGLHTSYEAGINVSLISREKKTLDRIGKIETIYNRHHYLCSREPDDMQAIVDAGFTDDFTLGYADMAGFRLGTCRPVKWINPKTRQISNLTLHPLAIMDCTLNDKRYMYMNAHDAYQYCMQLIDCVESYNGELVLLWHNTMVEKTPQLYHRKLYKDIVKYLKTK
ncbi:MAG: polysaccharide deacetylase family protein [Paludibacter sp.]|nr:polysaccharide deacetylase family protein [Paludibacter sp.]